jgi:hypothetical protein
MLHIGRRWPSHHASARKTCGYAPRSRTVCAARHGHSAKGTAARRHRRQIEPHGWAAPNRVAHGIPRVFVAAAAMRLGVPEAARLGHGSRACASRRRLVASLRSLAIGLDRGAIAVGVKDATPSTRPPTTRSSPSARQRRAATQPFATGTAGSAGRDQRAPGGSSRGCVHRSRCR